MLSLDREDNPYATSGESEATDLAGSESSGRIGCGTIVALGFVAVIWMLLTFVTVGRAVKFGVNDGIALTFLPFSLGLLVLVVIKRGEILKSHNVLCPKCGTVTQSGQYAAWQFLVTICFFPLGLLSLLAGRVPAKCRQCEHTWES